MPALSALSLAVASALAWACFDLARRYLAARVSAWTLVLGVTAGALPPLVAWGLVAGEWRVGSGYALPAAGSVVLNLGANFAYSRAFQLSPLSVTLPMLSLTPVFTALFGAAFLRESIPAVGWAAILLVVAGAALLGVSRDFRFEPGSVLMLLVALLWSAALLLDKLALRSGSANVHALVLNGGVAIGALAALAATRRLADARALGRHLPLLAAAVLCGATALTLQLLALAAVPVGLLETLKRGVGGTLAVVWGRAFFREPVTARKVLAVVALVAGVAVLLNR
jgi:drug/metabolite transporter (DMT)-like permease